MDASSTSLTNNAQTGTAQTSMTESNAVNTDSGKQRQVEAGPQQARAHLYWFFSSLFSQELSKESLVSLAQGEGADFMAQLAQLPAFETACERFQSAVMKILNHPEQELLLRAEYTTLFLMSPKDSAPLYASYYLSESQEMYEAPHHDMVKLLTAKGLDSAQHFNEPLDHVAIQLDYLGNLILQGIEQTHQEQAYQEQTDFIDKHLLNWLPKLSMRVTALQISNFYQALTELLLITCQEDRSYLKER